MGSFPNHDEAFIILQKHTASDALLKHALSVEGVMRHFAGLFNEDAELWGTIGLLHDIDYEKYPSEHCVKAQELLKNENVDESIIRACASHGYGLCVDIAPESNAEKVLYTIDELTGLIAAAALMRPSKSVMDIEVKSVKKKYKTPSFAAGVDRAIIEKGAALLEMELDYIIEQSILGMRYVHEAIGL